MKYLSNIEQEALVQTLRRIHNRLVDLNWFEVDALSAVCLDDDDYRIFDETLVELREVVEETFDEDTYEPPGR